MLRVFECWADIGRTWFGLELWLESLSALVLLATKPAPRGSLDSVNKTGSVNIWKQILDFKKKILYKVYCCEVK